VWPRGILAGGMGALVRELSLCYIPQRAGYTAGPLLFLTILALIWVARRDATLSHNAASGE
jgi:hypothetical protein